MRKLSKHNRDCALPIKVIFVAICQIILNSVVSVQAVPGSSQPLKRFEYKYSFKPPYLAQKDGTVPFFEYSGSKL